MRRLIAPALVLLALGCHRTYVRDPLTAQEIIALVRAGSPSEDIIRKIDESRTIYILDSEDIVNLHEQGVPMEVIEHMRRTRERAYGDYHHHHRYHYYPYYYPYFGFGFSHHCW